MRVMTRGVWPRVDLGRPSGSQQGGLASARSLGQCSDRIYDSSDPDLPGASTVAGGVSSSVGVMDDGWVETDGDCCIVAVVAELVVCERVDGMGLRSGVCFWVIDRLCRVPLVLFRPGDPFALVVLPCDDGEVRRGLPWLVTRIVVRLSSLLPRREPG